MSLRLSKQVHARMCAPLEYLIIKKSVNSAEPLDLRVKIYLHFLCCVTPAKWEFHKFGIKISFSGDFRCEKARDVIKGQRGIDLI